MLQKILYISLIALLTTMLSVKMVESQPIDNENGKKVDLDDLINETLTHVNQRSSFITDGSGPASIAAYEPEPKMFPDFLDKPPVVVENFVVPQLDMPFSEYEKAPLGAGFTYNWQAPWSGF